MKLLSSLLFALILLANPAYAAGKGDTFENDLLKLIFCGTAITDIAENDATSPLATLYVSLHSADPTDAGNQTSSECAYTSYARVAKTRGCTSDWTVTGNSVSPTTTVTFPAASGSSCTVTHWAVGTATSGTGKLLYVGTVSPSIAVTNGVTPKLTTATAITED